MVVLGRFSPVLYFGGTRTLRTPATKDIIVVDTSKNVDPNRELVADLLTNDFGFHRGTRSKRSSKNSKFLRLLSPVGGDGFIYIALPVRQCRVYLSRAKQKIEFSRIEKHLETN